MGLKTPAGVTHNQLRLKKHMGLGKVFAAQQTHQHVDNATAYLPDGLPQGSQTRLHVLCYRRIVESGHGDIAPDDQPPLLDSAHGTNSYQVEHGDNGRGSPIWWQVEQGRGGAETVVIIALAVHNPGGRAEPLLVSSHTDAPSHQGVASTP